MNLTQQKRFALALLEWHGGQNCPVYAVGSCMLSDSDRHLPYEPTNHRGHADTPEYSGAVTRAALALRNLKRDANYPEAVTPAMERQANLLAARLAKLAEKQPTTL